MHALSFMLVSKCDVLVRQKPKEVRFKCKIRTDRHMAYTDRYGAGVLDNLCFVHTSLKLATPAEYS